MFYNTAQNNHNLPYNPFKACIVPRPIGWISSQNKQGQINLAPYSYFNAVSDVPPMVMFVSSPHPDGTQKDSLRNIEETGEFVVNIASFGLHEQVNLSSSALPYGTSEAEHFNIETAPSNLVKPPRVKASAISLECQYLKTVDLDPSECKMIIGQVIGIYIDDNVLTDGKVDIAKLKPIARLGYNEYALIDQVFKMTRA